MAAFVALTMHHMMGLVREKQKWPMVTAIQHPMLDLAICSMFAASNPVMEEEEEENSDPDWLASMGADNTAMDPSLKV